MLDDIEPENVSIMCRITGRLGHPPLYQDGEIPLVSFPLIETLPDRREESHDAYTTKHRIQMIRDLWLSCGRIEIVGIVQQRAQAFPERMRNGHVIFLLRVVREW